MLALAVETLNRSLVHWPLYNQQYTAAQKFGISKIFNVF